MNRPIPGVIPPLRHHASRDSHTKLMNYSHSTKFYTKIINYFSYRHTSLILSFRSYPSSYISNTVLSAKREISTFMSKPIYKPI